MNLAKRVISIYEILCVVSEQHFSIFSRVFQLNELEIFETFGQFKNAWTHLFNLPHLHKKCTGVGKRLVGLIFSPKNALKSLDGTKREDKDEFYTNFTKQMILSISFWIYKSSRFILSSECSLGVTQVYSHGLVLY